MNQEGVEKRRVTTYDPIAISDHSTVVAEYVAEGPTAEDYQSEAQLENELIRLLQSQAYEYLTIHNEQDLVANLRTQLEALNNITFSDAEWRRFYQTCITSKNDTLTDKTRRIHEDHIQVLTRDDGTSKNIRLLDKNNVHNNHLQVINQYEVAKGEGGAKQANRYDVTILVNGLPMVHIELKRRGVDIREAFNQINRYQRESFWSGSGLFHYVQLFIISNGTLTKYYSNTTRQLHIKETNGEGRPARGAKSFEFTSWWADANNQPIRDLIAFAKTFLSKRSLLNILTKYCVFTVDSTLMVMRPYQIVAAEKILQRIEISTNYPKRLGTTEAGGYIWHTTGSGKTLTSFKTAQLAAGMDEVAKVLFVVDRKDLDYQTMREYDRFQKGAANSNTSTNVLKRQLSDSKSTIIITTIQKLSNFIAGNKQHKVYNERIVIIFDECHRSQFGEMHAAITKAFKKYNLFGFTGTPIFAGNSSSNSKQLTATTEQVFGEKLHTYTIVDAITDKNVLPFRIDYVNTLGIGDVNDKQVTGIDTEEALMDDNRMESIARYTLEHFNQKTRRDNSYQHSIILNIPEIAAARHRGSIKENTAHARTRGFNAIFAASSIEAAWKYYGLFKKVQEKLTPAQQLKIAMIYSFAPNEQTNDDGILGEEGFETNALPMDARSHLEEAIADYNAYFGTSYDTSSDKFQNYYKDLSLRMKNREVDIVIVVNMFLTGFDATTLNTLFVDKNLKSHGLIQAYSRTNRILNSVKTYGNIVCFRNLEEATNDAIALFGNKDARGVVLLKPYAEYLSTYSHDVTELLDHYPLDQPIIGETAQKRFIKLFGKILRIQNILTSFDQFSDDALLTQRQEQDYRSIYLDLYADFKQTRNSDKEKINNDLVFEIELIKQVEINVDYILLLVRKYQESHGNGDDKEIRTEIARAVDSSPSLRNKRDLIEQFVATINADSDIEEEWQRFIRSAMDTELNAIIAQEKLKPAPTHEFMEEAFRNGTLNGTGTAITTIFPPVSRFNPLGDGYVEKKARVLITLGDFFNRFRGLIQATPL
ncbi:type I restriction endonuclease subunit R [Corynebacterium rouxii]|uniref:type I restriction endonuclease subunit R n=1 Tax=Corynebacterium rouxii TaxID=2719119 RepID=UPI00313B7C7E